MTETLIEFFIDGKLFAARTLSVLVPHVGDEVRFNGICYKVTRRVFIYDESIPMIGIDIRHLTSVAGDVLESCGLCRKPKDDCTCQSTQW